MKTVFDLSNTELDMVMAQKVLGLRLSTDPDGLTADKESKYYLHKNKCLVSTTYAHKFAPPMWPYGQSWHNFSPTTNKADAMTILELCGFKVSKVQIHAIRFTSGDKEFWINDDDKVSDTLELAICRYAYRVFGC
jgi:hypothetical protein